jgi:hypothetical protein
VVAILVLAFVLALSETAVADVKRCQRPSVSVIAIGAILSPSVYLWYGSVQVMP